MRAARFAVASDLAASDRPRVSLAFAMLRAPASLARRPSAPGVARRHPAPPPPAAHGARGAPRLRSRAPLVAGRRCANRRPRPSASDADAASASAAAHPPLDSDPAVVDSDPAPSIEIPERPEHVRVHDAFLPAADARALREVFDAHHEDPRRVHAHRFVWDYWHVPGQYTLLRTPAQDYFPEPLFAKLESALAEYAAAELGCVGMTPLWLSCYVDGCEQHLHADVPHGPWAFVLSLTNWTTSDEDPGSIPDGSSSQKSTKSKSDAPAARAFTGGETILLRPETLEYWRGFDADATVERDDLVRLVEPEFNRLLAFDPRVPHGVQTVRGTRDPRLGRLVVHGWFNDPAPVIRGGLRDDGDAEAATTEALARALPPLYESLGALPRARGVVAVKVTVEPDGSVSEARFSADALVPAPEGVGGGEEGVSATEIRDAIMVDIAGAMLETTFPPSPSGEPSVITLPFVFD